MKRTTFMLGLWAGIGLGLVWYAIDSLLHSI